MSKNILLINPWIYDFAAFDLWLKPLGLLYLSSVLKQYNFQVSLIDVMDRHHPSMVQNQKKDKKYGTGKFYSDPIDKPEILNFVPRVYSRYGMPPNIFIETLSKTPKPDVILLTSMMTYWYPGVRDTVQYIRKVFPDVPIILGGIYAILLPEHATKLHIFDFICSDNRILNVGHLLNQILKTHFSFSEFQNFTDWPIPDFSHYSNLHYGVLTTSLGCVYKCTYCASPILYPKFYQKSWKTIFQEIMMLYEQFHFSNMAFYDDALFINKTNHIIPLLKKIIDASLPINFHTPNGLHTRLIDDELAYLLYEAKFKTIRLSLETSDSVLQKKTGGKITNTEYEYAIKSLHKAGYTQNDLKTYILAGMPNQTMKQIKDTILYVKDLGATPSIAEYSIIPGTKDWFTYKKKFNLTHLDPLIHNNSIFSIYMNFISFEELKTLKQLAQT